MFIPFFECSGHLQFTLPGIVRIEAEFNSNTQIIIGSNGAGKTTLLRELNPLPASASDYAPGGYKRIIVISKGKRYFLESFFGKPIKHTFEVDGENLNISGKETEQRKLVKDHFGITTQLVKMATGEIQFSSLSSQARRDWLMSISGMNFEYAMQLFQRTRDFNREAQALSKSMVGRQADEIEKLGQIGDVKSLKNRASELSKIISQIMKLQSSQKPRSVNEIKDTVEKKLQRIKTESDLLVRNLPRKLVYGFEDIKSIDDLKVHGQTLLRETERFQSELSDLYRKKEDLIQLAEKTRDQGISLEDESLEIKQLKNEIENIVNQLGEDQALFTSDDVLFTSVDDFYNKFIFTIESYVDNTGLKFNSNYYRELTTLESAINSNAAEIDRQLNGIKHSIKHQSEMPDADCPDCGKHFKIGNAEQKISELEKEQSSLEDKLAKELNKRDSCNEKLREFEEFKSARKEIFLALEMNTSEPVRRLKTMMELREKEGTGSRGLQDTLHDWFQLVTLSRNILNKRKNIESREFALKHLMEVEELRKHYEGTQLDDVDVEIERVIQAMRVAKDEISKAKELVSITTIQLEKFNELKTLQVSLVKDAEDFSFYHEQTLLNSTLLALQSELAGIQTTVSKVDSIQHTIDNLAKYHSEYERDSEASKKLMEMISPNSGLIAEHVMSYLEDLVEEATDFISRVWEYDMEILPCKLDADVIDYKFPVRIANDDKLRKDIAEVSKGQLVIINLIFRLVILSSVEKCIMPLYLDEPTEGFDEQHCENFVRFIKGYLEQGASEQVIMISHDFAGHASFTHAETMVLDEKNILNKPPRYNQHVKFDYA